MGGPIQNLGYTGPQKQSGTKAPTIPGYAQPIYSGMAKGAQAGMAPFFQTMQGALGGDRSVTAPFTAPLASTYTPVAGTYAPMRESYTPTAGGLRPLIDTYTSLEPTYQDAAKAVTAPMWQRTQDAMAELQKRAPMGGGQMSQMAQMLQRAGVDIGAAQGQVAQQDIAARNAYRAADQQARNQLALQERQLLNAANMGDIQALNELAQRDIQGRNALNVYDAQQRNQLAMGDVQSQNQMMQNLFTLYAQLLGRYTPQDVIGGTTTSRTAGNVGVPFADITV